MFSADISQVQFWEDNHYQRMTDGDGWDYLFPKFTHPSPWSHTNTSGKAVLMEDFVLIAEFSEQEGPRPVIVIPKDGGSNFDQNEFSVKILAVDHQSSIVEGSKMTEDAQVVMSDTDNNAHAFDECKMAGGQVRILKFFGPCSSKLKEGNFKLDENGRKLSKQVDLIHHIVLNDIQARGYVRPFCISYVTADPQKIMKCYETISTQMKKVAKMMKYGNRLVFMRDLEKYLEDLDFTKAHLLISQRSQISSTANDNEVLSALNTIRQSMEEVKDIMSKLRNMLDIIPPGIHAASRGLGIAMQYFQNACLLLNWKSPKLAHENDVELEDKFQAFERQLKIHRQESGDRQEDTSSLKDFPIPNKESDIETSGSYTDRLTPEFSLFGKSKDLKPKLLDVSTLKGKRRFDRSLRGLHELCSWGAREGLRKLRSIRECLMRDYQCVFMDEMDETISIPDSSLLAFGYDTIGANFLTCYSSRDAMFCKRKGCTSHPIHYPTSLGSMDSFKSLPSSYHSFLDDDTLYSARSSVIDSASQLSSFERQTSVTDSFHTRDSTDDQEDWIFQQDRDTDTGQEYSTSIIHSSFMDTIKYEDITQTCVNTSKMSSDSEYYIIDKEKDLICSVPGCSCSATCQKSGVKGHRVRVQKIPQESSDNRVPNDENVDYQYQDNEGNSQIVTPPKMPFKLHAIGSSNKTEKIEVDFQKETSCVDVIGRNREVEGKLGDKVANMMTESTSALCDNDGSSVIQNTLSDYNLNCDREPHHDDNFVKDCGEDVQKGAIVKQAEYQSAMKSNMNSTACHDNTKFSTYNHVKQKDPVTDLPELKKHCDKIHDVNNQFNEDILDKVDCDTDDSFLETESLQSETDSLDTHDRKLNFGREKLTLKIESTLDMNSQSSVYARKKEKLFLPFSNRQEADSTCMKCLQKVLSEYSNLQHVIYSMLSGRPVVIVGTRRSESQIREMLYALIVFTPIVPSYHVSTLLCQIKQLKLSDIQKVQLRGVIRSENRPTEYLVPASVRRFITLVDVDKMLLQCQPYQGMMLNFVTAIYSKKRSFKSERALYNYVQMCLMDIATKAFNFYHCITESDADMDFCGVCVPRKSAMLELSSEKYLNKYGLLNSDSRIVKNLAELVKIQQIEEEFKCKYLTDSPVYPFHVSYQHVHTYRL